MHIGTREYNFFDQLGPVYGASKKMMFEDGTFGDLTIYDRNKFYDIYNTLSRTQKIDYVLYCKKNFNNFKNGLVNPSVCFCENDNKITLGKLNGSIK